MSQYADNQMVISVDQAVPLPNQTEKQHKNNWG